MKKPIFTPIVPRNSLDLIANNPAHFALGQEIYWDGVYDKWMKQQLNDGKHIIIDNGAAEEMSLNLKELTVVAATFRGADIAMPDVLFEGALTYDAVKTASESELFAVVEPQHRMIIPQGRSITEWLECAERLINDFEFGILGIPKHLERLPGGRRAALEGVARGGWYKDKSIHMLGFGFHPLIELVEAMLVGIPIRSWDSAAPFAYAHALKSVGHLERESLDWQSDFATQQQVTLYHRNVLRVNGVLSFLQGILEEGGNCDC